MIVRKPRKRNLEKLLSGCLAKLRIDPVKVEDTLYKMLKTFLRVMGVAGICLLAYLLFPLILAVFSLFLATGIVGLPVWIVVYYLWKSWRKKKGLPN